MEENRVKGIFITFEGPDGSGKTTQLRLLAEYLKNEGYDVITAREPGGTVISDQIRKILLDPNYKELENQTEILLYASSRAQLVHEKIIPALKEKKIILCDRFIDASIAYQAYGLNFDESIVKEINRFASSGLEPDRTYLLNVNVEVGRERLFNRNSSEFNGALDRIEQKDIDYHNRVLKGFFKISEDNKKRIVNIDANQTVENIFKKIKNDVDKFLDKKIEEGKF